jgi:hypothetical protein
MVTWGSPMTLEKKTFGADVYPMFQKGILVVIIYSRQMMLTYFLVFG